MHDRYRTSGGMIQIQKASSADDKHRQDEEQLENSFVADRYANSSAVKDNLTFSYKTTHNLIIDLMIQKPYAFPSYLLKWGKKKPSS